MALRQQLLPERWHRRDRAIYLGVMNRDPLDRPGCTNRVQQQLIVRPRVAVRVPGVHWHEHDGLPLIETWSACNLP